MEEKNIIPIKIKKANKLIAEIYFCVDYDQRMRSKSKFIENLVGITEEILIDGVYFKSKRKLRQHFKSAIFGEEELKVFPKSNFDRKEIARIIGSSIKKCHESLPFNPVKIFVFPTFLSFVKDRMSGVTGFGIQAIQLFLNPNVKGWKTALKKCVCHEFNHVVYNKYHRRETLLDEIIYEGLAQNFKEHIVGGKQAPWTKALTLRKCKTIFSKIERLLNSKSQKVYRSVFFDFEGKKYHLWSGYSIGYHIVRSFLKNNKEMSWKKIMRLNPKEILEKSRF
jgi:uncharacterized protein YjaZ